MSGLHTQGRLVFLDGRPGRTFLTPVNDPKTTVAAYLEPADGRRLAACWNFFNDSIRTEFIETDSFEKLRASFVAQRAALERAKENLNYYQGYLSYSGGSTHKVNYGDIVPAIEPVRVAALVDELAEAKNLLHDMLDVCNQVSATNTSRGMPFPPILDAKACRIREFLKDQS